MVGQAFLEDAIRQFHGQKKLVERAIAQIPDPALFSALDEHSNSIAVLIRHMSGNMISRWTDFLVSDGEKPNRNRDSEFEVAAGETRQSLLARWEIGWQRLFEAVGALSPEDLTREVRIRGEPHGVVKAINRQLTHYAYHAGQIVFLAKHHAGSAWVSLSIPRGESEQFNASRRGKSGTS